MVGFEPTIVGRVRQCPRCELRFGDEWELEDHLSADHGVDWVTTSRWLISSIRPPTKADTSE